MSIYRSNLKQAEKMFRQLLFFAIFCVFVTTAKVVKKDQPKAKLIEEGQTFDDAISGVGEGVFRRFLEYTNDEKMIGEKN